MSYLLILMPEAERHLEERRKSGPKKDPVKDSITILKNYVNTRQQAQARLNN